MIPSPKNSLNPYLHISAATIRTLEIKAVFMTGTFHFFDLPAEGRHNILFFQLVTPKQYYGTAVANHNAENKSLSIFCLFYYAELPSRFITGRNIHERLY
jgi:hypothetical protein